MDDKQKHKMQVLYANAKDSKLARREIARQTEPHKDTTAKGRLRAAREGRR